ncbi:MULTISPECIES: hypothetical protein [Streptomyces]|uniref:Uncharacterized protein n=1 Tax=Streptomyces viridochromogenes TaxID=1938 RepID=A0A0L8K682_STRVR|nr:MULTISPECIES: hypothetical protein [Streptomyces]KOG21274.1 hypothetical protein ADK34_22750 [Streptomyces viridochromogenes]
MQDLIAALLAWLLGVLAPGCGQRRAGTPPPFPAYARGVEESRPTTTPARQSPRERIGSPQGSTTHPRPPYGLAETFAGEDTALIRPYLIACERQEERARQRWRCVSLVLAADFGIDLDTRDVHAAGVA